MINALLENRPLERWSARLPRSILYEYLTLLALTVAPFFLFGPGAGPITAMLVLWFYLLWAFVLSHDKGPKQPVKIMILSDLFDLSFGMIHLGLIVIAVSAWAWWAFHAGDTALIVIGVAAATIVPSALFIVFAPRLARKNGGAASRYLQGIREQGYRHFHRNLFGLVVFNFGLLAFVAYVLLSVFLSLASGSEVDGIETSWDLAVAYPILPLTLLIAATMLPAARNLFYSRAEADASVRAYSEGVASGLELDERSKTVLGFLAAGLFAGSVIIGSLALATVPFVGDNGIATRKAVNSWVAGQREAGKTTAEIAAELNRFGAWTPDAPEAGLATLIEEPDTVLAGGRSIATAAGVADLSGHGAIAWLPGEEATSDLKYCIRMTCPVAGQTEPMFVFLSSHATRNRS